MSRLKELAKRKIPNAFNKYVSRKSWEYWSLLALKSIKPISSGNGDAITSIPIRGAKWLKWECLKKCRNLFNFKSLESVEKS